MQNAFDVHYEQVAFNSPRQGDRTTGSSGEIAAWRTARNLYSAFLAEPRTFGVTVRTRF